MSRIGKKPIELPKEITVSIADGVVTLKGKSGELKHRLPPEVTVEVLDGKIEVKAGDDSRSSSMHGTTRSIIANHIAGLLKPYVKELEIQGVGFKAQQQGTKLVLALGYSHPIEFNVPAGITAKVNEGTAIVISGADKQTVGEVAARLRSFYPAEPYKGKGVRYKGEHVRRKAGKAVA
jgi:large subunit ribosomal protein L6